jgi:hypothetical protein
MIKLYKREEAKIRYWEAWDAGREITIHWGDVGETGETRLVRRSRGESAEDVFSRESAQPRNEGFSEIPLEEHATIVVQYKVGGWGSEEDLSKRFEVEAILNESLGWTGNGHCDGGDIGSGTINAFSLVVEPHLAKDAIVDALSEKGLLEGAVVAFHRGEEDFTVLWPENFSGKFSIL